MIYVTNVFVLLLSSPYRRRISGGRLSSAEPVTAGNASAFAGYLHWGKDL